MPVLRRYPDARAWLEAHLPEELSASLQLDGEARKARSRRVRYNTCRRRLLRSVRYGLRIIADQRDVEEVATALEARVTRPEILSRDVVRRNARLADWLRERLPEEPTP